MTLWVTLGLIMALGLAIRLYDLTDPPLDFHSTRQLWSAIIARGMYYQNLDDAPAWQHDLAIEAWKSKAAIEPTIFESVVAFTYQVLNQEIIWIPRIYASLFWLVGGVGLYALVRDMISVDSGIIALLFYIFVPFGAIASRSFQPDPLMVMWVVLAWWAFYRWFQSPSWKTAIIVGLFSGFAMLIKSVAVFLLLGGMAAALLFDRGLKNVIRNGQIWLIASLAMLPVTTYTLYGLYTLGMESQFEGRFFPELLKDPLHYVRWAGVMVSVVGFSGVILGLLGIFFFKNTPKRAFVIGLWGGYVIYGLFFPYHFLTHDYYHLPLIPLVALSLAPIADLLFRKLTNMKSNWVGKFGVVVVVTLGVILQLLNIRTTLDEKNYRHEPAYWQAIGDVVGRENQVVALTQDYGYRLMYYGWLMVDNWPETGHLAYRELRGGKPFVFDEWFTEKTIGADYFLVTRIKELERQTELKEMLYDHYPITSQGEGYILFDLNQPMQ